MPLPLLNDGRLCVLLTDDGALIWRTLWLELERGVKVLLGLDGSVRVLPLCPLNVLRLVPVMRCGRTVVRVLLSRFTLPSLRTPPKVLLRGLWVFVCPSGLPIVRLLEPMRCGWLLSMLRLILPMLRLLVPAMPPFLWPKRLLLLPILP